MPEHVHLLVSEPERAKLSLALQMLKQTVSRKLRSKACDTPFWQARYYDFNACSERKRVEKLRYMHCNPVKRGLVEIRKIGRGAAIGTTGPARTSESKLSRFGLREDAND